MTSIVIPDSVTEIGECAFYDCKNLVSIDIPDSVTTIGSSAFYDCKNLTSIVIPDSVTTIRDWTFRGCEKLTSIEIGNSVTSIGDYAFSGCGSLTSIVVDEGNPRYDSRNNCNAIIGTATNTLVCGCSTTIIPDSVTEIGECAFYDCKNLVSIDIPDSVTTIGSAFSGCKNLTSIVIPDSVTTIGSEAFWCCENLTRIVVDKGNPRYDSRNNCNAIIETATNTLVCGCSTTIIPDSVTTIGSSAFYDCKNLTSIVIPDSVTTIGSEAFWCCENLTRIVVDKGNPRYDSRNNCNAIIETATNTLVCGCSTTIIPDSVTTIGFEAFWCCENLTSIVIPNSVTEIGFSAFFGCKNLTSIVIPDSVTTIGYEAFYGCYALENIYVSKGKVDYFKRLLPAELHDKIVER